MRRLNKEVADSPTWDEYTRTVRRGIVLNMVETRRPDPDEQKILTPIGPPTRPSRPVSASPTGSRRGARVIETRRNWPAGPVPEQLRNPPRWPWTPRWWHGGAGAPQHGPSRPGSRL